MTSRLTELAPDVWVVRAPLRFMGMLELGTRMTVIKTAAGVALHSPLAPDDELKREIEAIGPVRFIIAPSLYHHLHAGDAAAAWPDAKVLAPSSLRKKRPDLRIDFELAAGLPDALAADLEALPIRGSMLDESVFHHRPSRTLVSSDLFENFPSHDHGPTRAYLKLNGAYGKPAWPRVLRPVYRDRKLARQCIEAITALPLDRIIIAHGEIVTERPADVLREALYFLF
jgi:hypothetical protein